MYFRCLGSTQHLKNKYGSGYVLVVKCVLEEEDWKNVEDDIFEIFDENKTNLDLLLIEGFIQFYKMP